MVGLRRDGEDHVSERAKRQLRVQEPPGGPAPASGEGRGGLSRPASGCPPPEMLEHLAQDAGRIVGVKAAHDEPAPLEESSQLPPGEGELVEFAARATHTPALPKKPWRGDRKSTRLNSSHQLISYAV